MCTQPLGSMHEPNLKGLNLHLSNPHFRDVAPDLLVFQESIHCREFKYVFTFDPNRVDESLGIAILVGGGVEGSLLLELVAVVGMYYWCSRRHQLPRRTKAHLNPNLAANTLRASRSAPFCAPGNT